ncbi:MAG: hypothetical protein AAFR51_16905 [Pseudomonadota bacterium]
MIKTKAYRAQAVNAAASIEVFRLLRHVLMCYINTGDEVNLKTREMLTKPSANLAALLKQASPSGDWMKAQIYDHVRRN